MKAKFLTAAPLLALSVLTSQAQAVDTTLTLSGQILPGACAINFAAGGIYDFGDITLAATGGTDIGYKEQDYTITCSGPTRVGMTITDNRSGTASNTQFNAFGLGTDSSGANIGYNHYTLLANSVVDGVAGTYLFSNDRQTWTASVSPAMDPNRTYSFGPRAATPTSPPPITTVAGSLEVVALIADKSTLDLTRVINIDGSATIELVYL